jgi:hypothetical protein
MSMKTPRSTEQRARKAARLMKTATLIVGAVIGLGIAYVGVRAAADRQWLGSLLASQYPTVDPARIGGAAIVTGLLWGVAQVGVLGIALHAVWRTFGVLADGEALDALAGQWLKRAGVAFAATAALMILAHPILSLAVSMNAPAGRRFLTIGIGSSELLALLIAGILVALGHVLALAAEISRENGEFV